MVYMNTPFTFRQNTSKDKGPQLTNMILWEYPLKTIKSQKQNVREK